MLKPKIAPTSLNVSDKVQDLSIIHAINLERLKQGEVVKVLDILDDLGLSIQKQLEKIDPTGVGPTYRARRLAKLLQNVKATTKAHFSKAKAANSKGLSGVASISAKATQNIINGSLGVSLGAALPSAATLQSLAGKVLIEGDVVSEYWKQQNAQVTGNFLRQMRMGVAGGEGLQSLIQRVRGTKENNFTDGIMNATKKKAETLVRSSVAAVNNEAIIKTYQANEDLFNGYQWMATLDSRTSDICKARSGLTWDKDFQPVGHGIGWSAPPAHFNCRSTVIGVLKPWADLANKPLPAVGAETLKEELTKSLMARGLSPALISKAINKTQQSMDGFVAGDINFEDWLKGKTERFQKAILGDQKWELWNTGKIGFVDLVDQKSHPRSLAELQALVDQGRTSPLKANKAAKEAAKQQAEAAALATKAAEKAENAAQAQIDEIASGSAGANKKKVYDKLKKDGIDGLSATQVMAKIDEGVAQINITANIAKAKKKLKDGKPLSKTEDAAWATVDDDLKAAYLASIAEPKVFKEVDDLIKSLDDASFDDFEDFAMDIDEYYSNWISKSHIKKEITNFLDDPAFFADNYEPMFWKEKLLKIKDADEDAAIAFVTKFKAMQEQMKSVPSKYQAIIQDADEFAEKTAQKFMAAKRTDGEDEAFDIAFLTDGQTKTNVLDYYYIQGPSLAEVKFDSGLIQFKQAYKDQKDKIAAFNQAEAETKEATEYLKKAQEGATGFSTHKAAYDKLSKSGALTGDLVADAAKVKSEKDAIQAAKSLAAMKTKIKKKLKDNKPLAPKEQEAFDQLPVEDQALLKEAASAGKTAKQLDDDAAAIVTQKATQRASDEGVLFEDLEQFMGRGGSNAGAGMQSKIDGRKFYVKAPQTDDHAKNEVLGAKLYKLAGLDVPEVNFIKITGKLDGNDFTDKLGVRSSWIEDTKIDRQRLIDGDANGITDGFAVDAWLANWDVVGAEFDNLKLLGDKVIRMEAGGALRYRAMGGLKGNWGNTVHEIDSLRDKRFTQNHSVFKNITDDQIAEGVRKVVNISDNAIRQIVEEVYGKGDSIGEDLISTLIARKSDLAKRFEKQLKPKKPAPIKGEDDIFTEIEADELKAARVNGITIPTDKDWIEDQAVHAQAYVNADGRKSTRVIFKVRGKAADKFDNLSGGLNVKLVGIDIESFENALVGVIKAFNHKVQNKIVLNESATFNQRMMAMKGEYLRIKNAASEEYRDLLEKTFKPILDELEGYSRSTGVIYDKELAFYKSVGRLKTEKDLAREVAPTDQKKLVARGKPNYFRMSFDDSFAKENSDMFDWLGRSHSGSLSDGTTVRYFRTDDDHITMKNRVEVLIDGQGAAAVNKALKNLEKELEIDLSPPTNLDREELYLIKIANRYNGMDAKVSKSKAVFEDGFAKVMEIEDQQKRIDALAAFASKQIGLKKDIRKLPDYNFDGERQSFGHGRVQTYFPELNDGAAWKKFHKEHYIYHDLTFGGGQTSEKFKTILGGGGQLISLAERLNRGLDPRGGASPHRDTTSGGASYVFTRLFKRDKQNSQGLYWKTNKNYRRTDAIHYENDYYGAQGFKEMEMEGSMPQGYDNLDFAKVKKAVRLQTIDRYTRSGGNEVIFKDTLSIFDDLAFLVVKDDREVDDVIAFMRSKGYKIWPDGRPLEDVIVTSATAGRKGYFENDS